jgi:selenide,water dikinase
MENNTIKLTQFSPGAGCGCKISPMILEEIIKKGNHEAFEKLLVGHESKDDAAVYDLGNGTAVISTTDFFMPITDDAFDFGRIASANAISDVYAMGGKPLMAISILGWPLTKLEPSLAHEVIEGSRSICSAAGIPLAGGHSIDSLEPIFGLAVTGIVDVKNIKRNNTAVTGCSLFLTKPLGIGILSTAQKKGLLTEEHSVTARDLMIQLNTVGYELGKLECVKAMTDVTGFGLLGHLLEMCEGSGLNAELDYNAIPKIKGIESYIAQDCIPGGTKRNFKSYGSKVCELSETQKAILCDPQTSGGLLIAVSPWGEELFFHTMHAAGYEAESIGILAQRSGGGPFVQIR